MSFHSCTRPCVRTWDPAPRACGARVDDDGLDALAAVVVADQQSDDVVRGVVEAAAHLLAQRLQREEEQGALLVRPGPPAGRVAVVESQYYGPVSFLASCLLFTVFPPCALIPCFSPCDRAQVVTVQPDGLARRLRELRVRPHPQSPPQVLKRNGQ